MIETLEGLKNVDEIAAVPGVGAIFLGAGGDLHQYLGVPQDSPEVEQARQTILAACKATTSRAASLRSPSQTWIKGSKKDGR